METLFIPDGRCLRHDHDFDLEDCYQIVGGQFVPRPDSASARCTRCGITLAEAAGHLVDEISLQLPDGGGRGC